MRASTRATAAGLLAGLLGLTVVGCGSQRAGGGEGDPPPLQIGTSTVGEALAGRAAQPKLAATLPDGPDRAAIHRYTGQVAPTAVSALAAALGLTEAAEQHAYGWSVGAAGAARLTVRADGTGAWAFTDGRDRCGPVVDVDNPETPDAVTSCATADDLLAAPPAKSRAADVAGPVLVAVGLDPGAAQLQQVGDTTWVSVDPRVEGLATSGVGTSVVVSADGIRSAYGHLGSTEPGADYPLVDAKAAWDRLAELPVPEIGLMCPAPGPESAPPCPTTPAKVTDVELGLTLRVDPKGPLLVPAWFFTTSDGGRTVIVAVAPRFLADPPAGDGRGDSGGGQGSSEPGAGVAPGYPGTG